MKFQFVFRIVCGAALLMTACVASAQLSTATVHGAIVDGTGAVIPNAKVTLTQTETGFVRTLTTNSAGEYHGEFLPVGPYTITVQAQGFKDLLRKGITLTVSQDLQLDLAMELGSASETITVSGEAPLINTGNATLSRTVDNKEIDNLPLVNRDVYQLLKLTPGVQSADSRNLLGFPEEHVFINGSTDGTVGQVSYYLDGGLNMTGLRNTGNTLPNPDAIREFVVQTNNFSAQYGRTSAGIVSVLTKSGTNQFHGSIFEFNRNTDLNATTHASTSNLPYHRNQFGATLGGPILHDKLFFFGSYGGLRLSQSRPLTGAIVPDARQRQGDFSENLPASSGPITSCNQALSSADKANTSFGGTFIVCNPTTRTPYPNNVITDALDPVAQTVLNQYVPLPTNTVTNQWIGSVSTPQDSNEYLIKADYQVTPSHLMTINYFQSKGSVIQLPPGGNVAPWSYQNFSYRQQNANVSDVWTLSPRTVNQFWLSYTRQMGARTNLPALSLADLGSTFNIQGPPQLPQIAVSGFFTLAQSIAGPVAGANVYGLRNVLSTTRGRHALYFGGELYLEKDAQSTLLNDYGVFSFTSSTAARTGKALSDFVLGRPNTMNQDAPVYANANYWNFGFFVQDDYRVTPRFTLNLGLRYDVQTPPTDTMDRITQFRLGVQSQVSPKSLTGQLFPGDPGVPRGGVYTRKTHFSPRVGFVWDPVGNGRTVFHAAAGLFYGTISGNEWELPSNFQPFSVRARYTHVVSMTDVYATDPTDFPGGVSPYPYYYDPANPRYIKPSALVGFSADYVWPQDYQFNFGIQQQIGNSLAVSASYVASLNRHLPLLIEHNYPVYNVAAPASNTTSTSNSRRPIQPGTISNLYIVESGQSSNYNGMQISITKRFSHGLSFNGYYTWSKTLASIAMDNNSLANNFEDYNLRYLDRQRSDYDIRNQSVTSVVWQPNYFAGANPVMHHMFDGWTLTGIITLQSGAPFGITVGSDVNGDGNNNDRPNLITGQDPLNVGTHGSRATAVKKWFNTSAFCQFVPSTGACPGVGPAGSDGTLRPNLIDAPGVRNVDASIFREFAIYDRLRFQLRTEVVNVFNLTNLGTPNGTFTSANFGKITGSNGSFPNRQIQLGGRIVF